jgi:putative salt-induced outer membrane protein YdiY
LVSRLLKAEFPVAMLLAPVMVMADDAPAPPTSWRLGRTRLDVEMGAVATGNIKGIYALNAGTKLTDLVAVESGSDNTLLQNDLGLQLHMSKTLGIAVDYEVRHNSTPPAGLVKTDSQLTFNLAYAFP